MVESKQRVLITGITGFLGSQTVKTFLDSDLFHVRGTVRDKKNMQKLQPLIDAYG